MKQYIAVVLMALLVPTTFSQFGRAADPAPVFNEDFEQGQSALSKWRGKHLSMWTVTADGVLVGNNTTDSYGIGARSPNFRLKGLLATFRFRTTDAKGVQFKLNYSGGGHIGRFIIQPDGFFFQANKNRPLAITEPRNFEKLKVRVARNEWHEFAIKLSGQQITGTLDGEKSKTYEYKPLDNEIGTFELSIMGKSAMFDDIVILPLPEGSTPDRKQATTVGNPKRERGTPSGRSDSHSVTHASAPQPKEWAKALRPFLTANCSDCHDDATQEGNLNLATLNTDLTDAEAMRRWVLVFDRVRKDEMPPQDSDRPNAADRQTFLGSLEQTLTTSHASQREVVLRRLNRAEYENTINDLFGTDIRLQQYLPEDASKHGFDNNGEGLVLSTELIEAYLRTADLILDRVFGPKTEPERIALSKSVRELVHDNMYSRWFKLLETDGGTVIYSSEYGAGSQLNLYKTPVEGTYRFRLHTRAFQSEQPVLMQIQTGILTRSGNKRFMGFFPVPLEGRVVEFTDYMSPGESLYPRPFGTLRNISGFLQQGKRKIEDYTGPGLHISKVEIEGPIDAWPPPSRKQLLGSVSLETGTAADAETLFARFLPRAFRRPVERREVDSYAEKIRALMADGRSFEDSLRWTLRAALCSADFLFLEEPAVERLSEGAPASRKSATEINDFSLANRLSYYLWSSMPDEELMAIAGESRLRDPDVLREQTERMLKSDKARSLTRNFAHQWLDLRDIDATSPDTKLYPDFDEHLKLSMVRESELFFEHVLKNDLSVSSFIDSDWLMLNERLARHYNIDGVTGDEFRHVKLPGESVRGGLMTQASILKVTANGANTSPVTRGVWMLEKIMGIHPPPPPPNVPAVVPDVTGAKTLRQLLDAHRGEPNCNSCHKVIDPPGFALESFDAIGGYRQKYRFQGSRKLLPVDATGVTASGDSFSDVREYKRLLLKEMDTITHGLAEKLLTYATGRQLGFSDREHLQAVVDAAEKNGYAFRELIHQTVQSPIFRSP